MTEPNEPLEPSQELPKDAEQHPQAPKIPGYILTWSLGHGGSARIWKAWQIRTRRWVAVKVFLQKSGLNWAYLQREIELLIRLDKHPHVVSLLRGAWPTIAQRWGNTPIRSGRCLRQSVT